MNKFYKLVNNSMKFQNSKYSNTFGHIFVPFEKTGSLIERKLEIVRNFKNSLPNTLFPQRN